MQQALTKLRLHNAIAALDCVYKSTIVLGLIMSQVFGARANYITLLMMLVT